MDVKWRINIGVPMSHIIVRAYHIYQVSLAPVVQLKANMWLRILHV